MRRLFAVAVLVPFVACSDSTGDGAPAGVEVALDVPSLTIGLCLSMPCEPEAAEVVAAVYNASGNYLRNEVTWSSSNPAVASVVSTGPASGSVAPHAKGTATITATVVGTTPPLSAGTQITVRLGGILDLQLSLSTNTLSPGQAKSITMTARNSGEEALTLSGPTTCLLAIRIVNGAGTVVYNSDRGCSGDTISSQLGSGQQRVQVFPWDGSANSGTRVPPGTYAVEGFVMLGRDRYPSQPASIVVQ